MKKLYSYSLVALITLVCYYFGVSLIQPQDNQLTLLLLIFVGYFVIGFIFSSLFKRGILASSTLAFALGFLGAVLSTVSYRFFLSQSIPFQTQDFANSLTASLFIGLTVAAGALVNTLFTRIIRLVQQRKGPKESPSKREPRTRDQLSDASSSYRELHFPRNRNGPVFDNQSRASMIRAVIFDMDGVIVDSEPMHIEAEKQTLLKHGVKITTEELRKYTGVTAEFEFNDLIKKHRLNTTAQTLFNEKEEILFKLLEEKTEPTKGIIDLIRDLKQQNLKLGIATSGHRKLANYYLRKLGIESLLDAVVCAEDIIRSKPDPEIFQKTAERLGVEPTECIVIEDAKLGIEGAVRAGMKCIGYRNPNSGNQDLTKASWVVSDFTKLDLQQLLHANDQSSSRTAKVKMTRKNGKTTRMEAGFDRSR